MPAWSLATYVVYVYDSQTNCIKMLTTLEKTADFLNAIGKIYKAFSMHEKHQPYKLCTLLEAAALVDQCLVHLRQSEALIRNKVPNLPHSLNGPQGNFASKTVDSVQMLKCGFELPYQVLSPLGYNAVSLLSCMKLDVENMHSVVQHKAPLCTVLE